MCRVSARLSTQAWKPVQQEFTTETLLSVDAGRGQKNISRDLRRKHDITELEGQRDVQRSLGAPPPISRFLTLSPRGLSPRIVS